MISAFLNTVKIPELRRRILFTLAVIVIVRLGAAITTPGVNQAVIQESSDAHREGEVMQELQRGYMLGDRLLRPAMVKVAKG